MSDAPLTDDELRSKVIRLPADWGVTRLAKECLEHRAMLHALRKLVANDDLTSGQLRAELRKLVGP